MDEVRVTDQSHLGVFKRLLSFFIEIQFTQVYTPWTSKV